MRAVILDNWGPTGLLNAALAEWPEPAWRHWHFYNGRNAVKRATKDASHIPLACMMLIQRMAVLDLGYYLLDATAFPDLELHGAGMHEIPTGGYLSRHLDSSIHPQAGWGRAANAVLFLNDTDGGELVFDDKIIKPERGKLVLFETSDESHHEVLEVRGKPRRTLSLFWWTMDGDPKRMKAEFG